MLQLVGHLERLEPGQKRPAFGGDLELDFDGGPDVHAGQVGDQDFSARVTLGRGVPAGVHHVDFVLGNFLARAGLGNHHAPEEPGLLAGRIVINFQFGLPFLSIVAENALGVFHPVDRRVRVGHFELLVALQNFRVGFHRGFGGAGQSPAADLTAAFLVDGHHRRLCARRTPVSFNVRLSFKYCSGVNSTTFNFNSRAQSSVLFL